MVGVHVNARISNIIRRKLLTSSRWTTPPPFCNTTNNNNGIMSFLCFMEGTTTTTTGTSSSRSRRPPFQGLVGSVATFSTSTSAAATAATATSATASNNNNNNNNTTTAVKPIHIWWASQGGTAQLFAQQLHAELQLQLQQVQESQQHPTVTVRGFHEVEQHVSEILQPDAYNILLTSVTGVGDPPTNGRPFYEWIMGGGMDSDINNDNDHNDDHQSVVNYTIFGLGNSRAHPNHYNTVAKDIHAQLQKQPQQQQHMKQHIEFFPMGLGDDGDCIEDDFDLWMEGLIPVLLQQEQQQQQQVEGKAPVEQQESQPQASTTTTMINQDNHDNVNRLPCPGATAKDGKRFVSTKYPRLILQPSHRETVCHDLFHLQDQDQQQQHQQQQEQSVYSDNAIKVPVLHSQALSSYGGEAGLREIILELPTNNEASTSSTWYETGDHCLVYPRNDNFVVEAYLRQLDVDPHAIITTDSTSSAASTLPYPFPTGLTVYETLRHCVDLSALPSPSLARTLLSPASSSSSSSSSTDHNKKKKIDYKTDIANPRKTVLSLWIQGQKEQDNAAAAISLEDLLYQISPMKPRYYSIASSPLETKEQQQQHQKEQVRLTFRPVKYMTEQGHMREGVCTNYMGSMRSRNDTVSTTTNTTPTTTKTPSVSSTPELHQHMTIALSPNPSFRLPSDPSVPILMIAGGCGIAPIRAFVMERLCRHRRQQQEQEQGKEKNGTTTTTNSFGPGILFVGFRSPEDQVYSHMIQTALQEGVLTEAHMAYTTGCPSPDDIDDTRGDVETQAFCGNVNELVHTHARQVWEDIMNSGTGHIYLCGGAKAFGAAMKQELLAIVQEYGEMTLDEATEYLRQMVREGRLLEDLAD